MNAILIPLMTGVLGLAVGYGVHMLQAHYSAQGIKRNARTLLKEAKREAASLRRDGDAQAKAEVLKAMAEFEQSTRDRRDELKELDTRVHQRESNLDRKVAMLEKKEHTVDARSEELEQRLAAVKAENETLERIHREQTEKLQSVSGMSREQAKEELLRHLEKDVQHEMGAMIRQMQHAAEETAERHAQKVVTTAVQRYVAAHANEIMSSSVPLPNDEMKGRIIGRSGRNIRALEAATGATILVDDTPEAVVISAFDPVRREIARESLERLIADGRIHPGRIEEVVGHVGKEMEEIIRKAGEDATYAAGVQAVDPELMRVLGRLKFRSSFAQNVLDHSVEVAHIMAVLAAEMKLDPAIARRVGLFHDIGKAVDHEVEGGHAVIGGDLLERHGESEIVANAVAAHHEDVEAKSLYAVLASTADAISGARPGARSETTELYIKRLENLEAVANSFKGVDHSYAIQAGREVRVIVQPDVLDDNEAIVLARNISKKVESELQYPGQIRVTVIRETRAVDYAK